MQDPPKACYFKDVELLASFGHIQHHETNIKPIKNTQPFIAAAPQTKPQTAPPAPPEAPSGRGVLPRQRRPSLQGDSMRLAEGLPGRQKDSELKTEVLRIQNLSSLGLQIALFLDVFRNLGLLVPSYKAFGALGHNPSYIDLPKRSS